MLSGKLLRNPYLLSILGGVLLRLSFPRPGFWLLAWVAFLPLFLALEKQKIGKAFLLSLICGAVFFIMTMFWLIHVTVPGMVVLSVYLAFFVAVSGVVFLLVREKYAFWQRVTVFPAFWVTCEFARGHFFTGMPWALLGNGQAPNLLAIQAADVVGAYGVSFVVVFVNILLFEFIKGWRSRDRVLLGRLIPCVLFILVWFGYGAWRLNQDPQQSCFLRVAVVQGNIAQEIKWAASFRDKITKKYQLLTDIVSLKAGPDLIVWPETSYPDYLEPGAPDEVYGIFIREADAVPLLAGSIMLRDMRYFNSAVLFSGQGRILKVYDKIHLVPFGEYIPLRKVLPFLGQIVPIEDFSAGKEYSVFALSGSRCPELRLSALICFEDIFGDLARRFVLNGADVLLNMTNDAWFGDTSSPYQHMQASVLRAVENRVYVVRSANTGISCFIDDAGRVYAQVRNAGGKPTFVTGYAAQKVARTARQGVYTKIGDVFALICIFYAMIMLIWGARVRR